MLTLSQMPDKGLPWNIAPTINIQPQPDFRERRMPDSPDCKTAAPSIHSPAAPVPPTTPISRPLSASSSSQMLNGAHSPHSSMNGRTPSPPSMGNSSSAQQLPPACGARQLSKLKRFLTTLQQFGSDISPEIGERVRSLVLGLVNNHLSIEEFHGKLQEATNFPLRPFVIPFLKANLPLLQRELLHCARLAKQSPQQYLAQNEHILFDPSHSPLETSDVSAPDFNENGKRRSPDSRSKENGYEGNSEGMHPAKRHQPLSPSSSGGSTSNHVSPNSVPYNFQLGGPIRLEDISISRELRERERVERERMERERLDRDRERHFSSSSYHNYPRSEHYESMDRPDDEWRHVENMLHCIINMVDKTKRALAVLQERGQRDRDELSYWMRRQAEGMDSDMKKRTSEMMASTLRQTEDRVTEVKRRAEEAVQEVKRQAVSELQKAVAAAEAKATELVSAERTKMERTVAEIRRQAREDAMSSLNQQEESNESCWNCGRKASETCSGCNTARYCSSFCQLKDWEKHHRVCGTGVAQSSMYQASAGGSSNGKQAPAILPNKEEMVNSPPSTGPVSSSSGGPSASPAPAPPAALPSPAANASPSEQKSAGSPTHSRSASRSSSPTDAKLSSQPEVAAH